ncbi:MAG: Hsp33 family molecular chaperone HslO [Burkholderiales bacterium]|nr:MAG: Hsp33 family molecular chaperone HslO [Burkholderiales bacterium]
MSDSLLRFLVRGASVRGEIVTLDQAWREVVARHALPAPVRDRLGELSAAAALLAATLKFDGSLVLQIHGDGPVALFVVECQSDGGYRATVKLREGATIDDDASLSALVDAQGRGRFVVTLDPRDGVAGRQAWQGIVPFEGETVAAALERYMQRSEQIPTRLWLAADGERAVGLLLQRLPDRGGQPAAADTDGWNRMQRLADTVTAREMLALPPEQLLRRLFWQESLYAFDERACRFACRCSRGKVGDMLKLLGSDEVEAILAERGDIDVHCEYCNQAYRFDAVDSIALFHDAPAAPGSQAQH